MFHTTSGQVPPHVRLSSTGLFTSMDAQSGQLQKHIRIYSLVWIYWYIYMYIYNSCIYVVHNELCQWVLVYLIVTSVNSFGVTVMHLDAEVTTHFLNHVFLFTVKVYFNIWNGLGRQCFLIIWALECVTSLHLQFPSVWIRINETIEKKKNSEHVPLIRRLLYFLPHFHLNAIPCVDSSASAPVPVSRTLWAWSSTGSGAALISSW